MRVVRLGAWLPALVLTFALAGSASAQVFGKNKVQYEPLQWSVLETQHLQLHYHAQEESLARELVVFAESVCVEYDARFRLPPRRPIPFLLYSEHHLFQQSNATPDMVSEGTGGLTELIKGRVLLPHTGSWGRLRWVTRHELTHAYMLEKLGRVMHDHHRTQNYMPPLWFVEGLAEFCGTTWDADAEGLLRDAVLSGQAEPLTRSDDIAGTVLMYKEGQSFLMYVAERYGREKIFDILDDWYRAEDFETTFRLTLGVSVSDVDRDWFESLKRRYYPALATTTTPLEVAQRLTPHGPYNLGPRALPPRSPADTAARFCFLSAKEGVADLVLSEGGSHGRRHETQLLRSGVSPSFESFHLFQNRPATSPSGLIAVVAKRAGRDVLYLVDSKKGSVRRRIDLPNLVAIHGTSLVPGDTAAVFTAQDYGGRADLYRVRWSGDRLRLERLTCDDFDDVEPDVSPDGRWVVFASDRADHGGRYSLFRLSLEGGVPEPVSDPPSGDDRQPTYSPDGKWIAFRSTRGGTSDLYVRPAQPAPEARRVTRLQGPASDPEWSSDGKGLLFTDEDAIQFQTYLVRFDPDSLAAEVESPTLHAPVLPEVAYSGRPEHYQRRISFDLVQTAVSYDPGLGGASPGGQVALSDVLGNEQIYIALGNDSERFGNFWDGFEGGVTYLNRARRLNWGLGLFRLTEIYDVDFGVIRREPRAGVLGLVSYPFSKFNRIESSVTIRHAQNHLLRNGELRTVDLVSNFVSLVHDDTRWTWMGPSTGSRLFLSAGFTRDVTSGTGDFTTLIGEVREYLMPAPHVVTAWRLQGQSSQGNDAQHFYLGGSNLLRGYDLRAFTGTRSLLAQGEIRFPLLRGLLVSVPSTWSFPLVGGVVFSDAGWVWIQGYAAHAGSVGAGFFLGGGYYPAIRWNYVWPTQNFQDFPRRPRTQFTISFNF